MSGKSLGHRRRHCAGGTAQAGQGVRRRARRRAPGDGVRPVKFGAAAITGNQRITIATLTTEVTNLSQAVKQYPGTIQLSPAQETQETLTWLVRFQINEELARQAGITVTTAQAEAALAEIYAAAKSSAEAQGLTNVTLDLILAANGIPPNLAAEVGQYQAIQNQFVRQVNGGQIPTSTSAQAATTAKLQHAQCEAAKALDDTDQPAVRPAGLHPVPGRLRAQPGGGAAGTGDRRHRRPGRRRLADRPGDQPAGGARAAQLAGLAGPAVRFLGARFGRSSAAARAGRGGDRLPGGGRVRRRVAGFGR